jgi:pilus assembly protein CpaE
MPVQNIIRVIIVDDITDTRENIKRMLQFDSLIEIVGMARSGREAIDISNQVKPDVIIMDINMPDMDGITATETIRRKLPYIQIVILSVQNDPNYMRRAMQAGVRDFLTKLQSKILQLLFGGQGKWHRMKRLRLQQPPVLLHP